MATPEDEIWEWANAGTPDKRPDRGRTYYKSVSVRRRGSNRKRLFRVGDPVVMAGDDAQVWIAQIVNLFQAKENDIHIKELMRNSTARNEDERRYELMRCTLRWFYNIADMNHHTLNTSRVPKPIPDEIWFSDHVEQDGFNDVQVIEGRAWLFSSVQARQAFVKDPDPAYDKRKDKLRIVRCFVDSKSDHLPVRELERTELEHLLRHPSTDKDLFENSRLRMYGSAGAVLKGTGKKKRRHSTIRSPVDVDEDEFEPTPRGKKSRVHGVEAKAELGLKGVTETETERTKARTVRRRKIIDNDDDDEGGAFAKPADKLDSPMDDDDQPLVSRMQELDQQQQVDARRIEKENEAVLEWVTELNHNAYKGDLDEHPKPSDKAKPTKKPVLTAEVSEVAMVAKADSSRRYLETNGKRREPREPKARSREPETIVIDDDVDEAPRRVVKKRGTSRQSRLVEIPDIDNDEAPSRKALRPKVPSPPRLDKKHGTSRQSRLVGKPFMPTQRARKPSAATGTKSTPSSTTSRAGTAAPQKRNSETGAIRHRLEKPSNVSKKLTERTHVRKGAPQSSPHQERISRYHGRPTDKDFVAEIIPDMDRMKLMLAKMPSETKSFLKGKMEWILDTIIDKLFDGRKERTHDIGDNEVRKIVDSTLTELQGIYIRGLKGSRSLDGSRSVQHTENS